MAHYYETDDETNIYIEDDPNYDPDALPPAPVITSPAGMKLLLIDDSVLKYYGGDDSDMISEMMDSYINTTTIEHGDDDNGHNKNTTTTIPPHEDPINETNCPETESKIKKGEIVSSSSRSGTTAPSNDVVRDRRRHMVCLSQFIKKWGICYMVALIVAIAVTGTVFMFREYNTTVKSSSSSSTSNEDNHNNNNNGDVSLDGPSTTPSTTPSVSPTLVPISYPSVSPSVFKNDGAATPSTDTPTNVPITAIPTAVPTSATPSSAPSTEQHSQTIAILREASTTPNQFNDFTSYESLAAQWVKYNSTIDLMSNEKIIQRYTMALLDLALHSKFTMALPSIDECAWFGVTCNSTDSSSISSTTTTSVDGMNDTTTTTGLLYQPVTSIVWNEQNMTSTQIPNDIVLLSKSLMHLDLSDNTNIYGTIPDGLYSCTQLQYLYLHNTHMTGSIGSEIGQLSNLKKLFIGNSALTGTIPMELGISTLEWLNLYKNQLTGSIPNNLGWTNMVYLDLGQNQLTGTIPYDWVDVNNNATSMMKLNALYLDHNMLNGTLPAALFALGDSTIEQIVLNDNLFTGEIPSSRDYPNYNLTTFKIQNNMFTRMDKEFCRQQSIYEGVGMLSVLYADCDICICTDLCATSCGQ